MICKDDITGGNEQRHYPRRRYIPSLCTGHWAAIKICRHFGNSKQIHMLLTQIFIKINLSYLKKIQTESFKKTQGFTFESFMHFNYSRAVLYSLLIQIQSSYQFNNFFHFPGSIYRVSHIGNSSYAPCILYSVNPGMELVVWFYTTIGFGFQANSCSQFKSSLQMSFLKIG